MKQLIILGFFVPLGLQSCQKDELETYPTDLYFTDLYDTIISVEWAGGDLEYSLDLDKDMIHDVKLSLSNRYTNIAGANLSDCYIKIIPINGNQIATMDSILTSWRWNPGMSDTSFYSYIVSMPKVFYAGDTIHINDNYSENSQTIYIYGSPPNNNAGTETSGVSFRMPVQDDYCYFGFYKLFNMKTRLAWLKVKIPNNFSTRITLNSCLFTDEEMLVIAEDF